jgi:hypothetical protein
VLIGLHLSRVVAALRHADDLASDKSPRLHDVAPPAAQFFVRGDFKKEMIVDEPHFARLPHTCVETEEGAERLFLDPYCALRLKRECIAASGLGASNRTNPEVTGSVGWPRRVQMRVLRRRSRRHFRRQR